MPSKSKARSRTLTDHEEIRRWAEERGAKPAAVSNTESDDNVGIIRLEFPGYGEGTGSLDEIDWDEWFEKFDDNGLALIVQDETANGERSNFNKLVSRANTDQDSRESGDDTGETSRSRGERSRSGSRAKKTSRTSKKKSGSERKPQGRSSQRNERSGARKGRRTSSRKKAA